MSWFWTWANQHNKTIQVWHYDSHVVLNKLRWISTAHVDGLLFGTRIHVLQSRTSATVYKYYYCTNQLKITKVVVLYCYSNYFNNIYGQLYVRFTNIEKINNSSFISAGTHDTRTHTKASWPLKILPLNLNSLKINILL